MVLGTDKHLLGSVFLLNFILKNLIFPRFKLANPVLCALHTSSTAAARTSLGVSSSQGRIVSFVEYPSVFQTERRFCFCVVISASKRAISSWFWTLYFSNPRLEVLIRAMSAVIWEYWGSFFLVFRVTNRSLNWMKFMGCLWLTIWSSALLYT